MKNTLKFAILAYASLIGVESSQAQQLDSTTYFKIKELQENVKREFAPDKRTKIVAIQKADIAQNQYVLETTEKDAKFVLEQKAKDISANIQVQLLPDASVGEKTSGVIRLSVANMRTFPDNAAELTRFYWERKWIFCKKRAGTTVSARRMAILHGYQVRPLKRWTKPCWQIGGKQKKLSIQRSLENHILNPMKKANECLISYMVTSFS